jgi:mannose/fructose/N-acetylgalactosamine-specific phosphotransferase system component IID
LNSETKTAPSLGWLPLTSAFFRTFFLQTMWNFERYVNYGFAFILTPILKKLYPPESRAEALSRHLEYFNTHPYMASFILGAVIRMEKERAEETKSRQRQKEDEINALKVGMMGPLAAMGDNLFWATIRPYCGLLAVTLVLSKSVLVSGQYWIVPLLFLAVYNVAHLGLRLIGFLQGYRKGDQVVLSLRQYGFQQAIRGLRLASVVLLGVLIVFVNLSDLEKKVYLFTLKLTFFTAIVGLFTFVLHKKISPSQVFYAVVLFALMLAFWPDLSGQNDSALGMLHPAQTLWAMNK